MRTMFPFIEVGHRRSSHPCQYPWLGFKHGDVCAKFSGRCGEFQPDVAPRSPQVGRRAEVPGECCRRPRPCAGKKDSQVGSRGRVDTVAGQRTWPASSAQRELVVVQGRAICQSHLTRDSVDGRQARATQKFDPGLLIATRGAQQQCAGIGLAAKRPVVGHHTLVAKQEDATGPSFLTHRGCQLTAGVAAPMTSNPGSALIRPCYGR